MTRSYPNDSSNAPNQRNMTKTSSKRAIRQLPALRASLLWFKRETVRGLRRRAACANSPKLEAFYLRRAGEVAKLELAELRPAYLIERTREIGEAPLFALGCAVPSLVRLTA